jgi:hypothetical protein
MPVKRGLADAARRLYSERSLLKYDTASHGVRFADVLELCHPKPLDPHQGDLFAYAIHRRQGHPEQVPESLAMVAANLSLRAMPGAVTAWTNPDVLKAAGMTWEDALSAVGSKVDKARLWQAMIPSMGYMALLRNLRNFDEAGISEQAIDDVIARLTDPVAVAKSRQFPYRFLSAHRAAPSLNWDRALEKALGWSCANVPALPGRTLVLVDTSGSMRRTVSDKSKVRHVDVAVLFGAVLATRGVDVDLVGYADGSFVHPLIKGGSVLKQIGAFNARIGEVGHGTQTTAAVREHFNGHARVVVISDEQTMGSYWGNGDLSASVPADVPLFAVNTNGYAASGIDATQPHRYEIGGFSDKLFTVIDLLSRGRSAQWPWEA